jgi:hypothetical protein
MASLDDLPRYIVLEPDPVALLDWVRAQDYLPLGYRRRIIQLFEQYTGIILKPRDIEKALAGGLLYD